MDRLSDVSTRRLLTSNRSRREARGFDRHARLLACSTRRPPHPLHPPMPTKTEFQCKACGFHGFTACNARFCIGWWRGRSGCPAVPPFCSKSASGLFSQACETSSLRSSWRPPEFEFGDPTPTEVHDDYHKLLYATSGNLTGISIPWWTLTHDVFGGERPGPHRSRQ
jgi:hypothetical protein